MEELKQQIFILMIKNNIKAQDQSEILEYF